MRTLTSMFCDKTILYDKLLSYGFLQVDNMFVYETKLSDNNFKVVVQIYNEKQIAKVIDLQLNEEYALVDVQDCVGGFVGKIRGEYENIILDIIEKCTSPNIFKNEQSKLVIKYAKGKYGTNLEFLWEKFPKNAVLRNSANNQWYAALLVIPKNRLGINSNDPIEIIDLRYQKNNIKNIVNNVTIFNGYHINKDNWITVPLDGSVNILDIYSLVDNSYNLSNTK